jgi:methyl-accepting chemotaxis protein
MPQPAKERIAVEVQSKLEGAGGSKSTIRLILFATLGCLALLAVAALGWKSTSSWENYRTAVDQKAFNHDVNRYIAGLYEILLERSESGNALHAAEPAGPAVLASIGAHRTKAADNLSVGLAALERWEFPNKTALLQEFKATAPKADNYRRQVDEAIGRPRDQRDEKLRNLSSPPIIDLVNTGLKIWSAVLHNTATNDRHLARLAFIKEIGWLMRGHAGRERAIITAAIAGETVIPANGLTAITVNRAGVDLLWQQLQNLTQDADTHPAIKAAMRNAREKYFKDFRSLSDEMRKAGASGAQYPMTSQQWVEKADPQIDSLLEVLYAARTASEDAANAAIERASQEVALAFGLMALGIFIAIGGMWLVSSRVTQPLAALVAVVHRLAANNTDVEIPISRRNDELGAMAQSLAVFRTSLIETHRLRAEQAETERRQAAEQKTQMMNALADRFEAAVGNIVNTVSSTSTDLAAAASTLAHVADDTQQLSTTVASASTQTSVSVRSISSATDEMSSSVGEIARQVEESSRMSGEAVLKAQKANARFDKLSEAVSRVSAVVKFITEIAEQTNLLALNATIEAARAGEAGRGFAVVASEVKTLATQAAKATEEITVQIAGMQAMTQDSVGAIQKIGATIGHISTLSAAIAAAVEEQSAATEEISRNIQQAAHGTAQVAANIGDVSQGAAKTSTASSQVLASARALSDEGKKLKLEVGRFLATVRAA